MAEADNGTKHGRVRAHILGMIESGSVHVGECLPGELELAQKLSVSRNTVRHAFGDLVHLGIVERTRGRGTVYIGGRPAPTATKAIGIINSAMSHSIYPDLIHGIEDGLYRGGYAMILSNANYDRRKERESIRRMLDQGIAGLVIEPYESATLKPDDEFFRLLNTLSIPVVTTNCVIAGLKGSAITVDDQAVGRAATQHLIDRGHRRIACVYKSDPQAGVLRFEGYRACLRDAGIPFDPCLVRSFDETHHARTAGSALTREILDAAKPAPTAFFYFNDEVALQAYHFLESRGVRIPEDVSVISVDNIREASLLTPPLTTFDHPRYVMGKLAAELMLAHVKTDRPGYTVQMQVPLIERDSVADLRGQRAVSVTCVGEAAKVHVDPAPGKIVAGKTHKRAGEPERDSPLVG